MRVESLQKKLIKFYNPSSLIFLRTSFEWPAGFTFSQTCAIFPSGEIRKVVRRTPLKILPMKLLSRTKLLEFRRAAKSNISLAPQTPYFFTTSFFISESKGKFRLNFDPSVAKPVKDYLSLQKRFRHLDEKQVEQWLKL